MVIAWDFPVVEFGQGRRWDRKYTDFYGTNGKNAWKIAQDGLNNANRMEQSDRHMAGALYK